MDKLSELKEWVKSQYKVLKREYKEDIPTINTNPYGSCKEVDNEDKWDENELFAKITAYQEVLEKIISLEKK